MQHNALTDFNPDDFSGGRTAVGDETLLVRFFLDTLEDKVRSQEEGRPIFREVEWIDIRVPGSHDNVVRPANQRDRDRFPRHYAAFKNRVSTEGLEGTLLSQWPLLSRAQVEQLSFLGIKTVEQLASVSDANGQQIMGFNALRKKAQDWLKVAAEGVSKLDLQQKLEQRDEEIAELRAAIEELKASRPAKRATKKKVAKKAAQQEETQTQE